MENSTCESQYTERPEILPFYKRFKRMNKDRSYSLLEEDSSCEIVSGREGGVCSGLQNDLHRPCQDASETLSVRKHNPNWDSSSSSSSDSRTRKPQKESQPKSVDKPIFVNDSEESFDMRIDTEEEIEAETRAKIGRFTEAFTYKNNQYKSDENIDTDRDIMAEVVQKRYMDNLNITIQKDDIIGNPDQTIPLDDNIVTKQSQYVPDRFSSLITAISQDLNIPEDQAKQYLMLGKRPHKKKKKLYKYFRTIQGDTISSLLKTYNPKRKSKHHIPKSCKRRGCSPQSRRKRSHSKKRKKLKNCSLRPKTISSVLREKPYQMNNSANFDKGNELGSDSLNRLSHSLNPRVKPWTQLPSQREQLVNSSCLKNYTLNNHTRINSGNLQTLCQDQLHHKKEGGTKSIRVSNEKVTLSNYANDKENMHNNYSSLEAYSNYDRDSQPVHLKISNNMVQDFNSTGKIQIYPKTLSAKAQKLKKRRKSTKANSQYRKHPSSDWIDYKTYKKNRELKKNRKLQKTQGWNKISLRS
ncbi:unnamed protein product [Moneuplotes crassus]|uniref:Uncharacterized protein n=1 Tax=Euplotes crassus TaxID=5936 RepID=A0AAD1Y8D9_EUPCR|nr:unnamed protein product [Moneuplotes crassus]